MREKNPRGVAGLAGYIWLYLRLLFEQLSPCSLALVVSSLASYPDGKQKEYASCAQARVLLQMNWIAELYVYVWGFSRMGLL